MTGLAIVTVIAGREGYTAEDLSGLCRTEREKVAEEKIVFGQCGGLEKVDNLHQLVRVGALISVGADGGCDGIDLDRSVAVNLTSDIPAAVRSGVK